MSAHTPGPWTLAPFTGADKWIDVEGPHVRVDYDDVCHTEQEANARLIAAAPELLGLLKYLRDEWFEPHYGTNDVGMAALLRDHIRAAIAKAEGRK